MGQSTVDWNYLSPYIVGGVDFTTLIKGRAGPLAPPVGSSLTRWSGDQTLVRHADRQQQVAGHVIVDAVTRVHVDHAVSHDRSAAAE